MNKDDNAEADVKQGKIKQGYLYKKSRVVKEWKKQWIVLTKNYLYSFDMQGVYKMPSQKISLKDITTTKSFYKNQYERSQVFRVQSDDIYFYLSAHDHQQKWAWMTAIQRMTEMIRNPGIQDSQNLIRQSLRMSSAVRQSSMSRKSNTGQNQNQINADLFKKLKLKIQSHTSQFQFSIKRPKKSLWKVGKLQSMHIKGENINNEALSPSKQGKETVRIVEKIVQVQVPVERVIEKVVEVQKVVYIQDQSQSHLLTLTQVFAALINQQLKSNAKLKWDPKPLIDFVVFLALTENEFFQRQAIQFSCEEQYQRFFAELILQLLNEQTTEERLNNYTAFIYVVCERQPDYFYVSDMRILVDIILRQLELYRSDLNQMINLRVLRVMLSYHLNVLGQKREDIRLIASEIAKVGLPENQTIASQILMLIE